MRTILLNFFLLLSFATFGQRFIPYLFPGEEFTTSGISAPRFTVLDAQVFHDTLFMISNDYTASNGSPLVFMKQGAIGFQTIGATVQLPNTKFQGISTYNNQLVVLGKGLTSNGTPAAAIHVHEANGWQAYFDPSLNRFQRGVEFNGALFLFDHLKARVFQNGVFANAPMDSVCSFQLFQGNLYFTRGNFGSGLYYLDAANVIHSVPGVCDRIKVMNVVNDQLFLSGTCTDKSFRLDPVLGVVQDDFGVAAATVNNMLAYKLVYSPFGNFAVDAPDSDLPFAGVIAEHTLNVNADLVELLRMTDLVNFENEWWAFGETPFNCPFQGVFRLRPGSIRGKLLNDHVWANIYPSWSNVYGSDSVKSEIGLDEAGLVYNSTPIINGISGSDTLGVDAIYSASKLGFVTGPQSLNYSNDFLDRYYRVWKLTQTEIDYHAAHWWEATYSAPLDIIEWPGNGNVANGEPAVLAPFHDLNGNAIYEPQQGETPIIKGDQAAFYLVNDGKDQCDVNYGIFNGATQFDLSVLVYMFNSNPNQPGVENTVFQDFRFLPRGNVNLQDAYFGLHADFDVGTPTDDLIGSDSLRSLIFAYNGDAFDQPSSASVGFGTFPPAVGVRFLSTTSSSSSYIVNASTLMPLTEGHFYNYQKGLTREGNAIVNPFTNTTSHYAFPGEVGVSGDWNELNSGNAPGDRRILMSSAMGNMDNVTPRCFSIAYTMAVDSISGGDSNYNSVALMKQYSDVAQTYYDQYLQNENCDQLVNVSELHSVHHELTVYPNPTKGAITVSAASCGQKYYTIYNMEGRTVAAGTFSSNAETLDVSALASGLYVIRVVELNHVYATKFEKN